MPVKRFCLARDSRVRLNVCLKIRDHLPCILCKNIFKKILGYLDLSKERKCLYIKY